MFFLACQVYGFYDECQNKYGAFVKVNAVKVGDYPEEEIDMSDDEM